MKKYFIFAASALALASCQSDEFLGEVPGNVKEGASSAINIGGEIGKVTRADHVGADAAKLLNKQFIVAGFKSGVSAPASGISDNIVFDHYTVSWQENTAGTTADNTSDWKYVGLDPVSGLTNLVTGTKQTIKYWDNSAAQYDFVAFSYGTNNLKTGSDEPSGDSEVKITKVSPSTAASAPTMTGVNVSGGAYTVTGNATALSKFYIADLITMYQSGGYGKEVVPKFRNLTCKARVAFYETVPGYSVKDVQFYPDDSTPLNTDLTSNTSATLYTTGSEGSDKFFTAGTLGIYFPTVGSAKTSDSDYNKAHVVVFPTSSQITQAFGEVADNNSNLKTTSHNPSFAGTNGGTTPNYYQTVLPNEKGTTLTLRVNYTLVSDDGSGEEIKVYGAKAIVPAIYAQWKSNYAYTYIFKISDNTNGWSSTDDTKDPGLFPITFDAVVVDAEEHEQSTITTVATPSITTYQKGHIYSDGDEYLASKGDIYVRVQNENTIMDDMGTKAALYTVTGSNLTEANIHDALTIGSTTDASGNVTGRNGITLTKQTLETDFTAIPGVDGNNINVTSGIAASFTPSAGTYAFVYETTTTPTPAETYLYTAVTPDNGTNVSGGSYYTDPNGATAATGTADGSTVYYQKITNNNKTYAIKVIKVVS